MRLPELKYGSPYRFTWRQRLRLFFLPPLVAGALRLLYWSCRIEVRHGEYCQSQLEEQGRVILGFWHESMGLAGCHYRGRNYHTLTSYSFDGEMAARVIHWFGEEAVRGSSSKGGADGLHQLEKAIALVEGIGITLDGPRGPRRAAKPGAAILAARSGVRLLPNAFVPERARRLHSWDRFPIPRPFSRIVVAYAPPIEPPADGSPESVEQVRAQLEDALNSLHREIETELGVDTGAA